MTNEGKTTLPPRRVAISGASGLIGGALAVALETQGHTVIRLVRGRPARAGELAWNPAAGEIDVTALEGVDAIVNLAGANVGAGRWTATRRAAIRRSRLDSTRTLVRGLAQLRHPPAVVVSASAVGFYGDRGDEVLTEESGKGGGFLADVCREWEGEAVRAASDRTRVVVLRFGVVLAARGGALAKLLPVFRLGLGGRVGSGRQWMSWVSIDDGVRLIRHAIENQKVHGVVNAVAPEPVTNREFTATLARVLCRPALLPVPAPVLKLILGEMAEATILASTRVVSARLRSTGFAFEQPQLEPALMQMLRGG